MRKKMKLKDILSRTEGPVDVVTSRGTYEMEYIAGEVFGVTVLHPKALTMMSICGII